MTKPTDGLSPELLDALAKCSGADGLSPEKRDEIISGHISSHEGRKKLAQAMASPIRGRIFDYVACPVCGEPMRDTELVAHAERAGDDAHRVLEVMES